MYFLNLFQQILHEMWARKLRTFLALFGIIWGTAAVILLLALGGGFYQASMQNMLQLVDGTFYVVLGNMSESYQGYPAGRPFYLKAADVERLAQTVPNIKAITPILEKSKVSLSFADHQTPNTVEGVSTDFSQLNKLNFIAGSRFLDPLDVQNSRAVIILGNKLKTRLFGNQNAIGKKILINQVPFLVIGVLQPPTKSIFNQYNNRAIIPYTTFINLWGDQNINYFLLQPNPNVNPQIVEDDIIAYLSYQYHFSPSDKGALTLFDTTEIFQFMNWFFLAIQIFLGVCGTLTLAVGGLGVANIMFLIVNERTQDIGLRMALGARDWHILLQILLEALIIVAIGASIGFLLSYIIVGVLQQITLPSWLGTPEISIPSVIITIFILAVLGILAGYFPGRRAANMNPVQALTST